jgi:uncharacterized protein (TIRG00374 family)
MAILKNVVKAALSIGLLIYLVYLAKPQEIVNELSGLWQEGGLSYFILATCCYLISLWVFALRWQVLVRAYHVQIPTGRLFRYYLIGLFFNNFLPTGIGGDVIRIYNLIRDSGDRTFGFASVMTERLLGILATLVLTLSSLFLLFGVQDSMTLLVANLALLGMLAVFFLIVFYKPFADPLARLLLHIKIFRLGERVQKFLDALRFYQNQRTVYAKLLGYSLLAQVLVIIMTWLLAVALQLEISLLYMFLVVPVTFLLTMLPSINGIGVRDGGYMLLLANVGISSAQALSLSFLSIIVPMMVSLFGGLLFLVDRKKNIPQEVQNAEKAV